MKKSIVMAFVALVMTVSVQAASFDWTVTLGYYTGQSAAAAVDPGWQGMVWLVATTGGNAGISVGNTGILTLGAGQTLVTDPGVAMTGGGVYSYTGNTDVSIGSMYVVVGYSSVGQKYGVSDVWTTTLNIPVPTEAMPGTFSNVGDDALGYSNGPSLEMNIAAVPEPTSMALLALGAAALGLRRKFRK